MAVQNPRLKKKPYKRSTVGNSSHQSPTVSHEGTASRSKRRWMDHGIPSYGPEEISGYPFCLPEVGRPLGCDTWRSDEPSFSLWLDSPFSQNRPLLEFFKTSLLLAFGSLLHYVLNAHFCGQIWKCNLSSLCLYIY